MTDTLALERPQAVTFDAAGTFLHFAEPVSVTYTRIAHEFNVEATELTMRQRLPMAFQAAPSLVPPKDVNVAEFEREWWRILVSRVYGCALDDADFNACFDALFDYFAKPEAWRIHDAFAPMLLQLLEMDVPLGVISNFDGRLNALLDALLPGIFTVVALPGNSGFQKPQTGIFSYAATQLDISPAHILHLGDNETDDVKAAHAAGMQALLWSFPLEDVTRPRERLLSYWGLAD